MNRNIGLTIFILFFICKAYSQAPVNDDCVNAISIRCGNVVSGSTEGSDTNFENFACYNEFDPTVWFKFMGDGQVQTFRYVSSDHASFQLTIVSETCNPEGSFFCRGDHYLSQGDSVRINTEPNIEYFIMIETGCCGDSGEFEFSIDCEPTIENDLCSGALPLSCNENISLYLNNASSEQVSSYCYSQDVNDVWYKIAGDDMFHIFELYEKDENINSIIRGDIYRGDCNARFDFCPQTIQISNHYSFNSFYAESGEEYVIRFFSNSDVSDTTELEHICMLPAMNDLCENAEEIACGDKLINNTMFASFSEEYNGCNSENTPDLWYKIIGDGMLHVLSADTIEGVNINIDIYQGDCNSEYNNCIQTFLSQPNEYNDEKPYNLYAELGTTYLIRLHNNGNGYFEISNDCMVPLENDLCENAIAINCDEAIEGDLQFSSLSFIDYPCHNHQGEYDLWYTIVGDGLIHSISIDSLEFNSISIGIAEGTCTNVSPDCHKFFNLRNISEYSFDTEVGRDYFLRVSSAQQAGFYRLRHSCSERLSNDECMSPAPLVCGEPIVGSTSTATISSDINSCYYINENDVWYSLEGDDLIHVFNLANSPDGEVALYIYEGTCDNPVENCNWSFSLYNDVNFYAESGKSYLIQLTGGCCGNYFDFEIMHECFTPLENDDCINGIDLSCDETLIVDLSIATPTYSSFCGNSNDHDLWYRVVGNGQLIFFESESSNPVNIDVYEGSCPIEYFPCPTSLSLESGNNNFLAELNRNYYIRISYYTTLSPFSLTLSCENIASNNECSDALEIECGQDIIGNTSLALDSENSNGCGFNRNKDLWYRIAGDDNIHLFSFIDGTIGQLEMSITTNGCNETQGDCLTQVLDSNYNISVAMESGKEYYIIISGNFYNDEGSFSISHDCRAPAMNDLCSSPEPIQCEQTIIGNTESASNSMDFSGCQYTDQSDLWYTLSGEGLIHSFNSVMSESGCITLDFFEASCPDPYDQCIFSTILGNSKSYKFVAETDTDYLIRVTSCYREPGKFELKHECFESLENDSCEKPVSLVCGERISGNTSLAFYSDVYNGCNRENEPDLWYTISGDDKVHVFDLQQSSADNLRLDIYQGDCGTFQTCILNNELSLDGSHSFLAVNGEEYLIRIYYQFNDSGGSFSLNYTCENPPDNDNCLSAMPISCTDNEVTGDLTYATSDHLDKDVWYSLEGDGQLHMFLYLSAGSFTDVEIYKDSCNGDLSTALLIERLSLGNDPLSFIAESGVQYLIRIVQGQSVKGAEFSFIHMCMNPVENDLCMDALSITCGENFSGTTQNATSRNIYNGCANEGQDDIWYRIEGDDQFHYFQLLDLDASQVSIDILVGDCKVLLGGCSEQLRLSKGQEDRFFAESGVTYLLRIYNPNFGSDRGSGFFEFSHSCYPLAENNECVTAMSISCGDLIQGTTKTATINQNRNDCYRNLYSDLWYQIQGNDQIHSFNLVEYENLGISVTVFEDSCDSTMCLSTWYLRQYRSHASFKAEANKNYLVSISSGCCNNEGYFEFEYSCQEPVINDDCSNAIALSCGDQINASLIQSSSSRIVRECIYERNNDLWYSISGDGLAHAFRLPDIYSPSVFIQLYKSTCENRLDSCSSQLLDLDINRTKYFLAEQGEEYLVRFYSGQLFDFQYLHECFSEEELANFIPQNDICEDAIELVCGDDISVNVDLANPDENHRNCGNSFSSDSGLWYYYTGDGSILNISGYDNNSPPYIYVYEDDCSNTVCTDNSYNYFFDREVTIETELDKAYYILVRSSEFNEEIQLSIDCNNDTTPNHSADELCEDAIAFTCGSTHDVMLKPASFLRESSGCDFENQNEVWFTYFGDGQNVVISTEANEFYSLYINLFVGDCNRDLIRCSFSDIMFPENNKYSFYAERGVEYKIRAFSFKSTTTALSLSFECGLESENNNCQNAIDIICGESFSGNLFAAGDGESFNGCNGNDFPDLWYTLEGDGLVHGFSRAQNSINSLSIEIYKGTCPSADDVCESFLSLSGSAVYFATQPNTNYLLRIYTTSNLGSEFALNHICGDPVPNDVCTGATLLSCRDTIGESTDFLAISEIDKISCPATTEDLWYLIEGDSKFHQFKRFFSTFEPEQFTIFESASDCLNFIDESCSNSFTLSEDIDSYSFFAEPNVNYFIRASVGSGNSFISFTHGCEELAINDKCEGAKALICGDTLSGNTIFAKQDSKYEGCDYSAENDLWYSIIGDNRHHSLEYLNSSIDQVVIQIFNGTCDDYYFRCVETIYLSDFNFSNSFFAKLGQEYLIKVYADCCEPGTFEILHFCHNPPSNDLCVNAEAITCDQSFNVNLLAASYSPLYSDCHNSESGDVWYTFEGDGMVKVFSLDSLRNVNTYLDIYSQQCTNKYRCIEQIGFSGQYQNQGFLSEPGVTYHLRAYTGGSRIIPSINLTMTCQDPPFNFCVDAQELTCGNSYAGSSIGATYNDNLLECYNLSVEPPIVWYKLIGDNSNVELSLTSNDFNPSVNLYRGDCDRLTCIFPLSNLSFPDKKMMTFNTDRDSIYYVAISSTKEESGFFDLSIHCEPIPINNQLINASNFICGESVGGSIVHATYDPISELCLDDISFNRGVWYSLKAESDSIELEFTHLGFSPTVQLFEVDGDSFHCLDYKSLEANGQSIDVCQSSTIPKFSLPCIYAIDDTVSIPIYIDNMENVIRMNMTLTFDTSALSFVEFDRNVRGSINYYFDVSANELIIQWQDDFLNFIGNDSLLFGEIKFTKKQSEANYSELVFTDNTTIRVRNFGGYTEGSLACLDDGMISFDQDIIVCDQSLKTSFMTAGGTDYLLYVSATDNLDDGDFNLIMNCAISEQASVIPTLNQWGLICLGLLFSIIGIVAIKNETVEIVQ